MINEKTIAKVKMLMKEISYHDWQKIKFLVDKSFEKQIGEFKDHLKLSENDLSTSI